MSISIADQTTMFLWALLLGGAVGVVYDIFRVLRRAIPHGFVMVLCEDILFFLLCTAVLSAFFLEVGGGEVRIFVLLGMLLGWVIYFFSVGSIVMRASQAILDLLAILWHIITVPIVKLGSFAKKIIKMASKPLISQKNRLKSQVKMLYNKYIRIRATTVKLGGKRKWQQPKRKKKKSAPPSTP